MTGEMPLRSRLLFTMELSIGAFLTVGGPEGSARRIANVSGGTLDGELMRGIVLPDGTDWQTLRGDGAESFEAHMLATYGAWHPLASASTG